MHVNIRFGRFHPYIIIGTDPYCQLTCFHYGSTLSIDLFLLVLLFIQNIKYKRYDSLVGVKLSLGFRWLYIIHIISREFSRLFVSILNDLLYFSDDLDFSKMFILTNVSSIAIAVMVWNWATLCSSGYWDAMLCCIGSVCLVNVTLSYLLSVSPTTISITQSEH